MSSLCPRHPEAAVTFTCSRCGAFGCVDCERRAQVDAAPICPGCWARQPTSTSAPRGTWLQTTGLVLGALSIIPCCPLALVSLGINIAAIVMAKEPPARDVRWRPILGLVLSLVFPVLQVIGFALYTASQHPTH